MSRSAKRFDRRNRAIKKSVSAIPGLDAMGTDWTALRAYSEKKQGPRYTSWSLGKKNSYGGRDVLGKTLPGSPCFHAKQIDYTFHRVLPALTYKSHPGIAKELANRSPRWTQPTMKIKKPWAFKQKQFYYRTRQGKRQRVKLGAR